ncbi:DUF4942 domain-containing protein [Aromatoleum evansii]|uniref:DUF4942 domain-containing protein n=1 Tax=Aromatoleum evansii TaxID=59406 RepID=A0ABZ1AUG6_AROEV|nr:DUF4942 domain-containing protein [Aromatoleum evansii]WRL48336.1 DUF4942 domain-containing protein [Aromatoleum evansii]
MGASDLIGGDESDWIASEFFAPAATDMVDGLMGQYLSMRRRVEEMAEMMTGETAGALSYFLEANARDQRYGAPSIGGLFQVDRALAALNAAYWSKAMNLTDVLDAMPQARRDEWNKSIREHATPEFEEETVRATLQDLLMSRSKFFAERVDGIFRALSGEHVTNSPMGFGKRMILAGIHNGYNSTERVGYINDLRCVIAKFMGRDEPGWNASNAVVDAARRDHGEWITIDGGALRLRVYLKGTAHLEVHPDMAWRLNCVLAQLYPTAIPSEFRQKPKKKLKEFEMIQRPLPFAVLEVLADMEPAYTVEKTDNWRNPHRHIPIPNAARFRYGADTKAGRSEAEHILASIGGVKAKEGHWQFDYPPQDVITEIVCSGCMPDQKTHQFYPTPERLARIAVELAEIGPDDTVLEPSAGIGGIADLLPHDRMRCIEISDLHCKVLQAKGYDATRADFMDWHTRTRDRFDRVVMNPPFREGMALAHLEAAAALMKEGGRIVAILPASMQGKALLPGWAHAWSQTYTGEFAGTGVAVSILTAERL